MSSKPSRAADRRAPKKRSASRAERADRHALYEKAVQDAEAEIDFVDETYENLRGQKAAWLREDFCGTANASCEWVRRRPGNHAIGVDLDPEVQAWGEERHVAKLGSARNRVELVTADVLGVACRPVDIVLAMNFSYWIFKERETLKRYFRHVHGGLAENGVFMLDAYGGADAHREMKERTEVDKFTYIWDQKRHDPITGDILCHIHFSFPDGSRIRKAFTYDWRLWTLPEIREVLLEAGFHRATVYWEGTDEKTQEGNGVFTPAEHGEADDAFIAYIVAEK
jgi:cyclopropane fatty-acyl-phospholipid synthase-like methyltransferase